jgi:drug/metabolite transporter (DMT)-like permease
MDQRLPAAFSDDAVETRPRGFGGFTRQQILTSLALGIVILLWASAFAGIRIALDAYTPTHLATVRYMVASAVLVIYALLTRMPLPKVRDLPAILLCGFVGFTLYNLLLNAGEQTVSTGVASFVVSSEIGVIAVLATLFLGERLRALGWIGVLTCLLGVLIISFSLGDGFQFSPGALLVFGATLSISVYSVMQKPLLRRYSAIQVTTYAIWAGTLCLLILSPTAITTVAAAPVGATLAVVYMGIFPGVIAYIAWSYVLSRIPASRAGSFLAIIPLVALLIGWLLLGEVPPLVAMFGGAVVLTGVLLVNRQSGG